ncbi:SRPBCC family protein [Pelagicoccus sp. NFK12]|uniref:SRPBCC family protein n=1 Tax=Pelagicoccus enzymogenes TaxID=2773457 RepID=A0A927F8F4_9BACT|nr:SRPBCC family protein [Pelagicoccus enzymogenes]MBD5778833.1 SRPBCC family protein [Pelagicoccus enzymogenes]
MYQLERVQLLPRTLDEVWPFFCDPQNLDAMTPHFLGFEIVQGGDEAMFAGQVIEYRIQVLPYVRQRWVTEISQCEDKSYFVDEQRIGPYRFWHHLHRFEETSGGVRMTDRVHYQLPFGPLGRLTHALLVKRRLKTIFDFRYAYLGQRFA